MWQFEKNAGEQVFARQMPGKAKEFAQVHFKGDFLSATPSREEELQAILSFHCERHSFSPPKIDNIQCLFSPWGSANAGNFSFSIFWKGDNLNFRNWFDTKFSSLSSQPTWHQSLFPKLALHWLGIVLNSGGHATTCLPFIEALLVTRSTNDSVVKEVILN